MKILSNKKRFIFTAGAATLASLFYYKQKTLSKSDIFIKPNFDEIQQRAHRVVTKLKSRDEHISEIPNTQYDLLIIGN